MSLAAGTRIGPYEIVAMVGAGGMGEVYRAHDARLGRDVALKILPPIFASDPDRTARFDREARTLATLNHPHIAAIYGYPIPSVRVQISTEGGDSPRWRRDGKETFYVAPATQKLMAVSLMPTGNRRRLPVP